MTYCKSTFEQSIPSILVMCGLKKTRDYTVSKGKLYLKKSDMKKQVVSALKAFNPNLNYYWETPHVLCWF